MSQQMNGGRDDFQKIPKGRTGAFPEPVPQAWRSDTAKLAVVGAFAIALGTAFGGAFLGVLADYFDEATEVRCKILFAYGALGLICFGLALYLFWRRRRLLHERGTAYLVIEPAETWDVIETRNFEEQLRNDFAQVLVVPSGKDTGSERPWGRTELGAANWSSAIDELTKSLIAVRHNDDHRTADAVFLWSDGIVATGLGKQLSKQLRDAEIRVRARPSTTGFGGTTTGRPWREPGHSYRTRANLHAGHLVVAGPTDRALTLANATERGSPVFILLARCTGSLYDWADVLPKDTAAAAKGPLKVNNGSKLSLSRVATVREIHIEPPRATVSNGSIPSHRWGDYPELAERVLSFWQGESQAILADNTTAVFLLAAEVPMEVNFGIGVCAHFRYQFNFPNALSFYDRAVRALIVTDVAL